MKRLWAISLLLCMGLASAAVHKVASDGTQPYTQISAAITAASSGDSVVVMAGSYNGFTVDKRLVIIGAGTGTGVGEGVLVTSAVEVLDAADSTELRSLWIRAAYSYYNVDSLSTVLRIRSGATRVFVWRCFIENTSGGSADGVWVGDGTSADISQCVLWASGTSNSNDHYAVLYRTNSNITLTSCVMANFARMINANGGGSSATAQVSHCVATSQDATLITTYGPITGVIENTAFLGGSWALNYAYSNMTYSYCAYTNGAPPGATHLATTAAAFQNLVAQNARTSDYHLAVGSNLIDAGNPGSPYDLDGSRADIGIYGGQHPYVDGGVPDYPFAVQVEVPYSAPLNGTMRIWGRGRVGPGN